MPGGSGAGAQVKTLFCSVPVNAEDSGGHGHERVGQGLIDTNTDLHRARAWHSIVPYVHPVLH